MELHAIYWVYIQIREAKVYACLLWESNLRWSFEMLALRAVSSIWVNDIS